MEPVNICNPFTDDAILDIQRIDVLLKTFKSLLVSHMTLAKITHYISNYEINLLEAVSSESHCKEGIIDGLLHCVVMISCPFNTKLVFLIFFKYFGQ